jgi:hypothetical protein
MKRRFLSVCSGVVSVLWAGAALADPCPSGVYCLDVTANSATSLVAQVAALNTLPAVPTGYSKVQLRVPAGTYTMTGYLQFATGAGAGTEVICMDTVHDWTNPPACVLDFSSSQMDGVYVAAGDEIALFDGFWLKGAYVGYDSLALGALPTSTTAYKSTAASSTEIRHGIWADGSGARLTLGPKIQVSNFYYGISSSAGAEVYADGARVYLGGDANFLAWDGGYLQANGSVSGYAADVGAGLGHGYVAETLPWDDIKTFWGTSGQEAGLVSVLSARTTFSQIVAQDTYSYGAAYAGYISSLGGQMDISRSYALENAYSGGGVGVWVRYHSSAVADSVVSAWNRFGFYVLDHSTVQAINSAPVENSLTGVYVGENSFADLTDAEIYGQTSGPRTQQAGVHCDASSSADLTGAAVYDNVQWNVACP